MAYYILTSLLWYTIILASYYSKPCIRGIMPSNWLHGFVPLKRRTYPRSFLRASDSRTSMGDLFQKKKKKEKFVYFCMFFYIFVLYFSHFALIWFWILPFFRKMVPFSSCSGIHPDKIEKMLPIKNSYSMNKSIQIKQNHPGFYMIGTFVMKELKVLRRVRQKRDKKQMSFRILFDIYEATFCENN